MQGAITAGRCGARLAKVTDWSLLVPLWPVTLDVARWVAGFRDDALCRTVSVERSLGSVAGIATPALTELVKRFAAANGQLAMGRFQPLLPNTNKNEHRSRGLHACCLQQQTVNGKHGRCRPFPCARVISSKTSSAAPRNGPTACLAAAKNNEGLRLNGL